MEDLEGLECYREDFKALASQIKKHESLLRLKRRWLMDLPLSMNDKRSVEEMLPDTDKILLESFIWEGDLLYEDVRACIETTFRAYTTRIQQPHFEEDLETSSLRNGFRKIFILLDGMTKNGLRAFIEILTGKPTDIDRISVRTKKRIKGLLSELIADDNDVSRKKVKQILQLLNDTKNFLGDEISHLATYEEYHAAVHSVMEVLEDFPLRTLRAMHRKLKGVTGYTPSLLPPKHGEALNKLIARLRKLLMETDSACRVSGPDKERLADAVGVASLALRLMNRPGIRDLRKISPETEALQNEIVKAIGILNKAKRFPLVELKNFPLLRDHKPELPVRSLRMAVRNLLKDYLFECSSWHDFPSHVMEIVQVINRSSRTPVNRKKSASKARNPSRSDDRIKDVMNKEIECVLTVCAQAKQVMWELLPPELELDEHFALRYYTEEFEGSDGLCTSDDEIGGGLRPNEPYHDDSSGQPESTGEMKPSIPLPTRDRGGVFEGCSNVPPLEPTEVSDQPMEQDMNQYVYLQQASKSTSMAAYHFVGLVLDGLAGSEGNLEISEEDRLYLRASSSSSVPKDRQGRGFGDSSSKLQEIWESVATQPPTH